MSQYVILVEGLLSAALTSVHPSMALSHHLHTRLEGRLDQAELHRVLHRLAELDVSVTEVHAIPSRPRPGAAPPGP